MRVVRLFIFFVTVLLLFYKIINNYMFRVLSYLTRYIRCIFIFYYLFICEYEWMDIWLKKTKYVFIIIT